VLGRAGQPSFRATADEIARTNAEIIVVMPCGYTTAPVAAEFSLENLPESWKDLPAIRERRIFAVDANSYFSRPWPRLADGVSLLAHLLHPELAPLEVSAASFQKL
jgi:iron complex transport system substrate-binding protein